MVVTNFAREDVRPGDGLKIFERKVDDIKNRNDCQRSIKKEKILFGQSKLFLRR